MSLLVVQGSQITLKAKIPISKIVVYTGCFVKGAEDTNILRIDEFCKNPVKEIVYEKF